MATDLEKLIVQLEARTKSFENALAKANSVANRRASQIERRFETLNQRSSRSLRLDPVAAGMSSVGVAAANAAKHSATLTAGMSAAGAAAAVTARNQTYAGHAANLLAAASARASATVATLSASLKASAASATLAGTGFGAVLGGVGAAMATQQIVGYADSWTQVTRALEANEEIFGVRLRSAEELNKLANDSRSDLDAFSKLYMRTAAATRDLGIAESDVAKATTTVAMALKLGSASAGEQASTMLQLSQALQKGKLDGDEFRAVMENAGVIQELLAEKLKVSKGEIIKMAAAGKLQVPQLIGALIDGAEKVERIFRGMPATVGEALTVLNNKVTEYVGHMNEATGGTQLLVSAISGLANNFDTIADSALVLGAAFLTAFAPKILWSVGALSLAIAAAAPPLGIVLALVGATGAAFALFGDDVKVTEDGLVSLHDAARGLIGAFGSSETSANSLAGAFSKTKGAADGLTDSVGKLQTQMSEPLGMEGFGVIDSYLDNSRLQMEGLAEKAERIAREIAIGRGFAARPTFDEQGNLLSGTHTEKAVEPKTTASSTETEDEKARKRFDRTMRQLESTIAMRRLEAETIGMSAFETERMLTKQELLNAAREAGVELSAQDRIAIDALAEANARAVTQAENLRNAYEEIRDSSADLMKGFINDLRQGTSAGEALANALNKIADKLIDMAVNDLVEMALGGLTGRGGNPQGPGLGAAVLSLIGFAKGGIAKNGRPLPTFANGGVSKSAAIFGEAGPEAAVPLPDGRRIPVDLRMPKMPAAGGAAVTLTVAPVFHVQNGTPEGIEKLKSEFVPIMKQIADAQLNQAIDRHPRLARARL